MKKIIWIFLVAGMLSCSKKQPNIEAIETENLTTQQKDSILTGLQFQYESPIIMDSTNYVLIPISTNLLEGKKSSFKISKDSNYSENYGTYWNVLFYNRETGENQLLTQKKIRISQIHAIKNQYKNRKTQLKSKVLFEINNNDYNSDGKLNQKDPKYLFCSETDGSNLVQISPKNEYLQFFTVIPESNQILIRTYRDTKKDSIFNNKDELIWYKAELKNKKWTLEEVINSQGRKAIENLYFEQWLKKKE